MAHLHGGKRPGSGPKKGARYKPSAKAIDKALHREVLRALVVAQLLPMTQAQISSATGIKFLVVRSKATGRFLRRVGASDPKTHDPDSEIIEIWEKEPSIQAYSDLLNRALDKPTEQVALTGAEGGPIEIIVKVPWRDPKKA